jgi:hypothetical protein
VSTVIVADEDGFGSPEFSWRAVFAGALVAIAVTFFLLSLGSGVGLSLISAPEATANTAKNALTLGAIYFFAAQAFGLVVGGYLAGRLMGPVLESEDEELFHSTTHGLVVWAVSVVATITLIALSGLVLTNSVFNAGALFGAANAQTSRAEGLMPAANGYWVDTLFRPAGPTNAAPAATPVPNNAARAQASRLLTVGLIPNGQLSPPDRDELVRLVVQSTGVDMAEAVRRVDDAQARIHKREVDAAEVARKVMRYVSLWVAASLIFGALVASGAAVSGRWVDDKARDVIR